MLMRGSLSFSALTLTTRGQPSRSATSGAGRSGTEAGRSPDGTACTMR